MGLPSVLFPLGFPTKNLYTTLFSPIRATCPANLISILSPEQYWVTSTDHYCTLIRRLKKSRAVGQVVQVVSCRLLTAEAWVQSQDRPHRICGGQSGTGTDFSPNIVSYIHFITDVV